MKKILLSILFVLVSCQSKQDIPPLMLFTSVPSVEIQSDDTVIDEESEPEESDIPDDPESPFKKGWIYLLDRNKNIVYESEIESNDTINGFKMQAMMMNQFKDPLCPCEVFMP